MKKYLCSVLAAALVAGSVNVANAQQNNPDKWDFALALYLWGTGLEGNSQIGPVQAPVDISFSDALDNLSAALMLHFEAKKNKWGFLANVMHIGLDPSASLPNGAQLNLDVTNTIIELAGTYSATPAAELLFGVRASDFKLKGAIPPALSGTIADESWYDAFVGARVLVPFAENWRFRARGDIGAGDSDLVWNAFLGVDYQFNKKVSAIFGYRWLDYDYDNGAPGPNRFVYDIKYQGPMGAVAFHW